MPKKKKTWEVGDVRMGKLVVEQLGRSHLRVIRYYELLDGLGRSLPEVGGRHIVEEVTIDNLPSDVLAALSIIDDWTYQRALREEGLLE